MSLEKKRFDVREFSESKMQKVNLFSTSRLFLDVYCLEPGQAQKPHAHADSDKIYAVLEGNVEIQVGDDRVACEPGDAVLAPAGPVHGLENKSPRGAAVLVFMSPPPPPKG